jgi:hypothetical protein
MPPPHTSANSTPASVSQEDLGVHWLAGGWCWIPHILPPQTKTRPILHVNHCYHYHAPGKPTREGSLMPRITPQSFPVAGRPSDPRLVVAVKGGESQGQVRSRARLGPRPGATFPEREGKRKPRPRRSHREGQDSLISVTGPGWLCFLPTPTLAKPLSQRCPQEGCPRPVQGCIRPLCKGRLGADGSLWAKREQGKADPVSLLTGRLLQLPGAGIFSLKMGVIPTCSKVSAMTSSTRAL